MTFKEFYLSCETEIQEKTSASAYFITMFHCEEKHVGLSRNGCKNQCEICKKLKR